MTIGTGSLPGNITKILVQVVLKKYSLSPGGAHGVSHWARVLENGRRLAAATPGARLEVVELFALFHDSQRFREFLDPHHGLRGARLAEEYRGTYFDLDDDGFDLLFSACHHHTDGRVAEDPTIQACWDADRLDLGRAMIIPDPSRLLTLAARDLDTISWANSRSRVRVLPSLVLEEWGLSY